MSSLILISNNKMSVSSDQLNIKNDLFWTELKLFSGGFCDRN